MFFVNLDSKPDFFRSLFRGSERLFLTTKMQRTAVLLLV